MSEELQWGHGVEAVETTRFLVLTLDEVRFNGATA